MSRDLSQVIFPFVVHRPVLREGTRALEKLKEEDPGLIDQDMGMMTETWKALVEAVFNLQDILCELKAQAPAPNSCHWENVWLLSLFPHC